MRIKNNMEHVEKNSPQDDQLDKKTIKSSLKSVNEINENDSEQQVGSYVRHRRVEQEVPTTMKKRQNTLNIRPSRNNKYLKITIPFDFEQRKFYLAPEDLNIYEFKGYLEDTLSRFNSMDEFKINLDYQATGVRRIRHIACLLFIHLIFGYFTFCLWHLLYFNLVLLMSLIKVHIGLYEYTSQWFTNVNNKEKIVIMKKILSEENMKQLCVEKKYTWTCGDHGYWIEMQKSLY